MKGIWYDPSSYFGCFSTVFVSKARVRVVLHSQTLFSGRGVIAFSISAPLESGMLILKAIMPLRENRVWLYGTRVRGGLMRQT